MNSFGKAMKGGYMGTKQETQIKMMPGPADYDQDGKIIYTTTQNAAFNQSERQ